MRLSRFDNGNPASFPADSVTLSGLSLAGTRQTASKEDFCYLLELCRVVGDGDAAIREGVEAAGRTGSDSGSLRPWETFVCRTYGRAKELMMDPDLVATDWIRCHAASDEDGETLEVFLSTGGHYLARIARTELF